MATPNEVLRDLGVNHAIGLRRLSTATVQKTIALLNRTDDDIVKRLLERDPNKVIRSASKRDRLENLLTELRVMNKTGYRELLKHLKTDLVDIGAYEATWQSRSLTHALSIRGENVFALPSRHQLVSAVTSRPFQGRLLKEWVTELEAGRYARLRDAVRIGFVEGESIDEMVRRIRGTRRLGYKDGVLEISRRSATAMTRTAVNHIATQARDMMYEENADVVKGWRFVAVLDSRTTAICFGLDGQEFAVGSGPRPPRHINCRSTTVPVVRDGGKVERITYGKWLKDQPVEVQNEVLGPTRAKLYRDGGLKIDRFADDNRAYTLDELRKREAAAFEKAFGTQGK